MECHGLRHIAICSKYYEASCEYYHSLGFATVSYGSDSINGRGIFWRKLSDGIVTIELIFGEQVEHHIAFTVDQIDESKYYCIAPSGHRVQFDRDPSGNLIEFVERKTTNEKTKSDS
jgi:catechol 2,3-dioxygenase-like lactoylglutathione lyase family enzyme